MAGSKKVIELPVVTVLSASDRLVVEQIGSNTSTTSTTTANTLANFVSGYIGSVGGGVGFTGSRGSTGFTGSASTVAGPTGFTGSAGSGVSIPGLTNATALDGTEKWHGVQGGLDRAISAAQMQALANELNVVTITANTTLDSSHYGKIVSVTTSGVVITFSPAPATVQALRVRNKSAGNITVNGVVVTAGRDIAFLSEALTWERLQPMISGAGGSGYPVPTSGMTIPGRIGPIANGASLFNGFIFFDAISVPHTVEISEISVFVATLQAASTAAVAIYADDGSAVLAKPTGSPIAQGAATFSTATTGIKNVPLAASVTLNAGTRYWAAIIGVTGVVMKAEVGLASLMIGGASTNPIADLSNGVGWQTSASSYTIGTWPSSPGVQAGGGARHIPILKVV